MRRKIRFSVRSLVILSALTVLAIWWLATPSANAMRFAQAVNSKRYEIAQSMFAVERSKMMLPTDIPILNAKVVTTAWTWKDLLRGRRPMDFLIVYNGTRRPIEMKIRMEAGVRGIHAVDAEERSRRQDP